MGNLEVMRLWIFIFSFLFQFAALLFVPLKNGRKSMFLSNTFFVIGLTVGLVEVLMNPLLYSKSQPVSYFYDWIRIDNLGLFFLLIIRLAAIPTAIYAYSYLGKYVEKGKSVRSFMVFYVIMTIFTQFLVCVNHAVLFLVSWEIMSMSGYLAMIMEREEEEVQRGSFYYFAASHVIVFLLYVLMFLLNKQSGSWFFSDFHISVEQGIILPAVFILAIVGFGTKAGFMPFHFWLPQAHPIAPTVLSAFLSGVIIKTGIYGIIRVYLFIRPAPEWCGWLMLSIGVISAVFGVWYALAQHDLKRLLAYHSVENIGIIGMGIGIGMIGAAHNLPSIEILGFAGALLHTLNHAIFKTLLFIGSGVIYQNLGTRNLELMGGIARRAKYFAALFLIGSVAICGLPPFNGFISEFIIYSGMFKTAGEIKAYFPILMLLFVVGLAFVGGLAMACFAKVNSIVFLGSERKEIKQFKVTVSEYLSLSILAALCILIGILPAPFIAVTNNVLAGYNWINTSASPLCDINWGYMSVIFLSVMALVYMLYRFKLSREKRYGRKDSAAWGCGYEDINARMQYSASSFADELNAIPSSLLVYGKQVEISENVYPKTSDFHSHSEDFVDSKIAMPLYERLKAIVARVEFLSHTDIRYYIGFILIIIIVYGMVALLWF